MARMATETKPSSSTPEPGSPEPVSPELSRAIPAHTAKAAPNSWGLGDGEAIPWDYSPAPESSEIVTIRERYGLVIGGREVPASDGATFTTLNPATEEPLAEVARATEALSLIHI